MYLNSTYEPSMTLKDTHTMDDYLNKIARSHGN
jgi:hypothetical protein